MVDWRIAVLAHFEPGNSDKSTHFQQVRSSV